MKHVAIRENTCDQALVKNNTPTKNNNSHNYANDASNIEHIGTTNLSGILEEDNGTMQLKDDDAHNNYDKKTNNINHTSNDATSAKSSSNAGS